MNSQLNNPTGEQPAGAKVTSRDGLRTVRRIEVTVEREVISVLHRTTASKGQESDGEETCALCGQTLPDSTVERNQSPPTLLADAVTSCAIPNEKPKE
jgi:hypothetical protein